jgi:hypothetical protein
VFTAKKSRAALDNHALEAGGGCSDLTIIFGWNRLGVKEVSRVVELELTGRPQPRERIPDLPWNRARNNPLIASIPPEVAQETAKRTFTIRDKDRRKRSGKPMARASLTVLPARATTAKWPSVLPIVSWPARLTDAIICARERPLSAVAGGPVRSTKRSIPSNISISSENQLIAGSCQLTES